MSKDSGTAWKSVDFSSITIQQDDSHCVLPGFFSQTSVTRLRRYPKLFEKICKFRCILHSYINNEISSIFFNFSGLVML
jgi:hypothetical protein